MTRRKVTSARPAATKRTTGRRGHRTRVGPAILGVVGVVAVAGVIAVVATGGDGGEPPVRPGQVTVTGEPLPDYSEQADPAIGLPAPSLRGEDFDGAPVAIEGDGRPKVVIFLAHWCSHCQREVPLLQGWLDQEGMPAGADLYSVATAIDPSQPNYPPDAWLRREGWTVPVLVDDADESASNAYGLTGFPFWVFVDADGAVTSRFAGELTIDQFRDYLETIGST